MERISAFLLLIFFIGLFTSSKGDFEQPLSHCCNLGQQWGQENLQCTAFPAPVVGIPNEQQAVCLSAVHICCLRKHRERQCDLGKQSARADRECSVTREWGGEAHKDCCEGCKLGLVAGSMAMSCSFRNFKFGAPWDEAYFSCCQQALSQIYPDSPNLRPQSNNNQNAAITNEPQSPQQNAIEEDLCERFPGELCAQVCVPTAGSFRCECREGFQLLADGKSCQQTTQNDRCSVNNLCAQKCTDTGLAIECSCLPGYELALDDISCSDIDECTIGVDTCDLLTERCINEEGSFKCIKRDGSSSATSWSPYAQPRMPTRENGGASQESQSSGRCPKGFQFNAESRVCDDVNECSRREPVCPAPMACTNTIGSFTCSRQLSQEVSCPAGFRFSSELETCVDIDECKENANICPQSRPFCVNVQGSFSCQQDSNDNAILGTPVTCPAGYKFNPEIQTCEDVDECSEGLHNCTERQSCVNAVGTFRCNDRYVSCQLGFRFDSATRECIDIDECVEENNFCSELEVCVNELGGYSCKPKAEAPEAPEADVATTTTTARTRSSPSAIPCPRGYEFSNDSKRCIDVDECLGGNACQGNQQCENTVGSFSCRCPVGHRLNPSNQLCEDINECLLDYHNCLSTQRCDNTVGSYTCFRLTSCGTGYTFNSETGKCEDDDECVTGNHHCGYLGPLWQCRNTQGSFRCERKICDIGTRLNDQGNCVSIDCKPGFTAGPNGRCTDVDECASGSACPADHRCVNNIGSFECINTKRCDAGYELTNEDNLCADIDECSRGTHECKRNQICQNRRGGYVCVCPQGFTIGADGDCQDVDECTRFAGQICSSNSKCVNTVGSYRCECKSGFRNAPGSDSRSCVDIDECTETDRLCQQNCANTWGSYQCSCNAGFTLSADNRSCVDVDECEEYKERGGLCVGLCVNEPGSYSCQCPEGYRLSADKRTCQDIDECITPNVCRSGETCLNTRGGYYCNAIVCPPNYVRDTEHRNRCKRISLECHAWDNACLRKPVSYSYNFLTLPSRITIPRTGYLDLFSMRGPLWASATVQFNLELSDVKASAGVDLVDQSVFNLRRSSHNQAVLGLAKTIVGPQEIELLLNMEMYQNGDFSGIAVVKIFIYVTQYDF